MNLPKTLDIKLCAAGYESSTSHDLASESEDSACSGIYNEDDEIKTDMIKNYKAI